MKYKKKFYEIALQRLGELNVSPNVIKGFKQGKIYMPVFDGKSYVNIKMNGTFKKMVRDIESKFGFLIYYCMPMKIYGTSVFTFLYVSKDRDIDGCNKGKREGWCEENGGCYYCENAWRIGKDCLYAYAFNRDIPEFSDFGLVYIKEINGTIVRVG